MSPGDCSKAEVRRRSLSKAEVWRRPLLGRLSDQMVAAIGRPACFLLTPGGAGRFAPRGSCRDSARPGTEREREGRPAGPARQIRVMNLLQEMHRTNRTPYPRSTACTLQSTACTSPSIVCTSPSIVCTAFKHRGCRRRVCMYIHTYLSPVPRCGMRDVLNAACRQRIRRATELARPGLWRVQTTENV